MSLMSRMALVEYYSDENTKQSVYRQSNAADTSKLLTKRLAITKSDGANDAKLRNSCNRIRRVGIRRYNFR